MAVSKQDRRRAKRRGMRVRSRVKRNNTLPRISVFRSLKHLYAQVHDDVAHTTVVSCSSQTLEAVSGDKKAIAHAVGLELAKRALAKGVSAAVFDRGRFLYHGRVRALAEGAREGGLKI